MNIDRPGSIVPSEGAGPLRRKDAGGLARPASPAPVHAPGAMGLSTGMRLRQECWNSLGSAVRDRLCRRAGTTIEWYATEDEASGDGRSMAVVFGDQALAIAEPRINAEHRPVYAISAYVLDPGSFRRASVDHRPPAGPPGWTGPPGPAQATGPAGPTGGAAALGLDAAACGVIGNLPPRAQELLQAPFGPQRPVLRRAWHYEGFEHRLTMFMIYLAGAADVTVATGTKDVPVGHTDASAHWNLTCYRASVTRRIGG